MKRTIVLLMTSAVVFSSCTTPQKRTGIGAGTGAAVGAAAGAVLGNQRDNRASGRAKGAMIGAGVGAILGSAVGNRLDKQAQELEQVAETKRTEEGIVTTLKNNILFDTDSSALKSQALSNVNQIAGILSKYPEDRVVVVGHTDNRGSASYNNQLSLQRAQAVKLQLTSNGVPSESVEAQGQGESDPIASNDTEAGRAKNRRVELHITVDQSKVQ